VDDSSLEAWIELVFDHRVSEPDWYWSDDAPEWAGVRPQIPLLVAECLSAAVNCLLGVPMKKDRRRKRLRYMGLDAGMRAARVRFMGSVICVGNIRNAGAVCWNCGKYARQ
jgi:hypothetical protein